MLSASLGPQVTSKILRNSVTNAMESYERDQTKVVFYVQKHQGSTMPCKAALAQHNLGTKGALQRPRTEIRPVQTDLSMPEQASLGQQALVLRSGKPRSPALSKTRARRAGQTSRGSD